jgi:hypothetical protein
VKGYAPQRKKHAVRRREYALPGKEENTYKETCGDTLEEPDN